MAIYGLNESDRRKIKEALQRDRHAARRTSGVITPHELFEEYPREIEWINGYSSDCPPGGVIKIYEYGVDSTDPSWLLHGTQPDDERGEFYAINGSSGVAAGEIGRCLLYGHAMARLPDGIEQGDKMYAKPGSWDAATNGQHQIGRALGYENTLQVNDAGANAALKPILLETDEPIYWLKRCHEPGLSELEAAAFQVGNDLEDAVDKVVKLDNGKCYQVYENNPDDETLTPLEKANRCPARCVAVLKIFDDCETCLACWKLTRCDDNEIIQYTRTDLSDYEGGVVKLEGDLTHCWEVSMAATGECDSPAPVVVVQNYADCDYCAKCYNVENCHDAADTRVVSLDLGELFPADANAAAIITAERVIRIDGRCYQIISEAMDCSSAEYPEATAYEDCAACACYTLTRCDNPATSIQVHAADGPDGTLDLGDYLTKTVRLSDGHCYTVADGGDCTSSVDVTVFESYDDCASCKCYTLHLCGSGDPGTTLKTYSDLSGYGVGAIVKQNTGDVGTPVEGNCYEIIDDTAVFSGAVEFLVFGDRSYSSCETCNATQKYLLTNDCEREECVGDPAEPILTTEDLAAAVGLWVKVKGICYSVAESASGDAAVESIEYDGPFETCEDCLAAVTTWTERVMIDMVVGDDGASWVKKYKTISITGTGACPDEETIAGEDCA